jgi:NADH dehydrogenase
MGSPKRKKAAMAAAGLGAAAVAWTVWRKRGCRLRNRGLGRGLKIVVLGAGFGGMTAARDLCRHTSGEDGPEIWLVDRHNYLLFTPMLTEVAGGELDPRHIVAAPQRLSPHIRFLQGTVQKIDVRRRTVVVQTGVDNETTRELHADHLVIALGSVTNYHHIPGLEEHSVGMKSIQDAAALHARVLRCIEAANAEPDPAARRELLTFVVGGGGFTGVETMAAINDLAREEARRRPQLSPVHVTAVIVEMGDRLLPEVSDDVASSAQAQLEANGVRIILKTGIKSASARAVELTNGERIPTRTLVWSGGVKPIPLIETLDCERGHHGGIVVDHCCAVPGRPGVWALGDCAETPNQNGKTYAPTAQNATREGELVARNILAALRGLPPRPFTYQPVGEVALVGRHSGVAKLYGRAFSGLPAWVMWRGIYLSKMPGIAQRSRITLDWLLDFVFGRNPAEVPLETANTYSTEAAPVR